MTPRRFLFVCHDAGGTVPPVLALAQVLVGRGHDVTILSQPSVRGRAATAGCVFVPFSSVPDYQPGIPIEEQFGVTVPAISGSGVGEDVLALVREDRADVVIVDANLAGGLAAAEAAGCPTAVLLHSMYTTFVDTWFSDVWPLLADAINETRAAFGLAPATDWPSLFSGHDLLLSVVPTLFDAPVADTPANMRHFGFLVPRSAPSDDDPRYPPGDAPAVLVGLSTTYQRQELLLQTILDALGTLDVRALATKGHGLGGAELQVPSNVTFAEFVPHTLVLGETDLMITHAGLGSVAAALSFGVPLVCAPLGRDQHLNAARVAELGTGVVLDGEAVADDLARAVERVLSDASYAQSARSLADTSAAEGGPIAAVAELESLARGH